MKKLMLVFVLVSMFSCKSKTQVVQPATDGQNQAVQKQEIQQPTSDKSENVAAAKTTVVNKLGPMDSIKDLDRQIDGYKSGSNLSAEDVESNRKLKEDIIRGTFDLYELCRLALDIHWNEIDDAKKKYFVDLMTRLLERKAIFSKEQVKGTDKPYKVSYLKESYLNNEKTSSLVNTKVVVPSEKVDLNISYKLIMGPNGWHIFDVLVDEASLVENYKFQFDTIIKKYGYQELIDRMEKKLKEME
ncbi:MAG: hypothetical protein ACD_73C00568G0002 [uncultured bacterium]|nr:MAG: hypothetical protein ACD_73C00568G0002 [uncultured bacterium]